MTTEALSVICAGLGSVEENEHGDRIGYEKGDFCLDNLKDLLLFLRRDDPKTREVFMQVCKWNITSKNLIPLVEHFQDDHVLLLNAVKVLVFLTMPIDPSSIDILQQLEYLWLLKLAITSSDVVPVILSLLEGPLQNLQCEAFKEADWKLVQLVVTFFRNVLAVQDVSFFQCTGFATQFLQYRDMFLELLFRENVMDVVLVLTLYIGSCDYIRHDNMLILETFHYIFTNQDPEIIVHSRSPMIAEDINAPGKILASLMEEEEEKTKAITLQHNLNHHSQFSGTFSKRGMDGSTIVFKGNHGSISSNTLNKPLKNVRGQLKKYAWVRTTVPSKNIQILEYLYDFLSQLLSGGYNVLIQSIREDIERDGSDIQGRDVAVFFQVAEFVTSFHYHKMSIYMPTQKADSSNHFSENADDTFFSGDICGPVAASMNWGMFLLVTSKWSLIFDGLKESNDYYCLSSAGALMRIMIRMLDFVLKVAPKDSKEPQTIHVILYRLFYDQTNEGITHFLLTLIKTFDPHKQSRSDLGNVVEILHVVFRLMENLQSHGTLRVSKKSRKGRKKKSASDFNGTQDKTDVYVHEKSLDPSNSPPEKATISSSPQKMDISSVDTAVPLSCPSEPSFPVEIPTETDKAHSLVSTDVDFGTADECSDVERVTRREIDFNVSSVVSSLAHSEVINNLCWLLNFYKVNSLSINHYIICMFRRICDALELSPILYQLSVLTTFHSILKELKAHPCKDYDNIYVFLTNFVRRMLRKMKNQPLLFVEILFCKTRGECSEIYAESLAKELKSLKKETHKIVFDSDNLGTKSVVGSQNDFNKSIADALGDDEADVVISYDIGRQSENIREESGEKNLFKTRRKKLHLNDDIKQRVKDLYEKYKDCEDYKDLISKDLDIEDGISTLQVTRVLEEVGIKSRPRKRVGAISQTQLECNDSIFESKDIMNDDPLPKKTLNSRKRIKAFTEEQEMMIKTFYEEYKGKKKCSFFIAKALDGGGAFSAYQVSKKLAQLGLISPRNIGKTKKMSNGGNPNISVGDGNCDLHVDDVDDEIPLSSWMKRRSMKRQRRFSKEQKIVNSLYEKDGSRMIPAGSNHGVGLAENSGMPAAGGYPPAVDLPLDELEDQVEFTVQAGREPRPATRRKMVVVGLDDDDD